MSKRYQLNREIECKNMILNDLQKRIKKAVWELAEIHNEKKDT